MTDDRTSLTQRIKELEGIHRLARSLISITDVYATLEAIVECYLSLCQSERAAVVLVGETPGETVQTVVRSSMESRGAIDHIVNTVVAGWLELNRKPLLVEDVVKELKIRSPLEQVRVLGPALAVPLLWGEKMIGLVNLVNSKGGRMFTEDEVRVASTLAPLAVQFIQRARIHENLFRDNARLKETLKRQQGTAALLGESRAMRDVRETIRMVAPSTASVLLVGETGTGKEVAARALHYESSRSEKAFVALNCSAIPATLFESELFGHEKGAFTGATAAMKGKFELADEGTLFLDEISAMPLELQPKLLRILEQKSYHRVGSTIERRANVRLISATNKDLRVAIENGEFREDLYHRLNVVQIHLPALSRRIEDIPVLANAFLHELSDGAKRFAPDALQLLSGIAWKGNVRELRNTVERISILISTAEISAEQLSALGIGSSELVSATSLPISRELQKHLGELLSSNRTSSDVIEALEKVLIELSLKSTNGNITHASRLLGIDRSALQRRIEKYGLDLNAYSAS